MNVILKQIRCINQEKNDYPFSALNFDEISFTAPITFLTGANGSGKSTLLRVIKDIAGAIDIGHGGRTFNEDVVDQLEEAYRLVWSVKSKRGFYLQSEDFLNFIQHAKRDRLYYEEQLKEVAQKHDNKQSMGHILESGVHRGQLEQSRTIEKEIGEASHGQGYLGFFKSRLRSNALYLLDEPETPLSFENQLALLYMMKEAVQDGCQFIICTHSPVLLAYPQAEILYLDHGEVSTIPYNQHPIVTSLKNFLEDPERFMHYLLHDE